MALKAVFDAWAALFSQYVVDDGGRPPDVQFTSNALALNKSPGTVVWVPTRERLQWSVTGSIGNGSQPIAARQLRGRLLSIQIHIWGQDFDDCELMIQAAVAAGHDIFWGYDDATGVDWTRGQATTAKAGVLAVLEVAIELPLTRQAQTLAVIRDFTPQTETVVLQPGATS